MIKEWVLCLLSKKHAANTSLRIDPDAEQQALSLLKLGLAALLVANALTIYLCVERYHQYQTQKNIHYLLQDYLTKFKGEQI